MLALHQFEIAARRATVRGVSVGAHAVRHHARERQLGGQALTEMAAEILDVLAPALLEVRVKVLGRALHRMDVAIDKAEFLGGFHLPFGHRLVHGGSSLRIAARF